MSDSLSTQPRDQRTMEGIWASNALGAQASAAHADMAGMYRAARPSMPLYYVPTAPIPEPTFQAPTSPSLTLGSSLANLLRRAADSTVPVKTDTRSIRERVLERDIVIYSGLQDGWDGEGSAAPSPVAIDDLRSLVRQLPPGLAVPKTMLSSSGTPGLYWDERDYFIDLEFHGEGQISMFVKPKSSSTAEKLYSEHNTVAGAVEALRAAVKAMLA